MFNSHVHSGVTTGPGSSGPTLTQATKPFSQFVVDDYEDKPAYTNGKNYLQT